MSSASSRTVSEDGYPGEKSKQEIRDLNNVIQSLTGQLENFRENVKWRQKMFSGLQTDHTELQNQHDNLKKDVDSLKSELAYQKAKNERLTTELEGANSNLERYIEHYITSQKNMSDNFFADLTALRQENMRLKNQLAGIQH